MPNYQNDTLVLSILTFNIWGLPGWIAKNKDDRITAIGKSLGLMNDVDVICLQEVWIENDYKKLKSALQVTMPHSHYFYSGVTGSGVCVFTKWPIKEILFHQWPLNGYIHMVHHGDWFGGKGVGLIVLDVAGFTVNVYTTHLHAQYHEDDSYLVHRVEQAFDTAMFIRLTSSKAHFSTLAGDLNTAPGSLCEKILTLVAELSDSYLAHDEESAIGTFDCLRNSYSDRNLVETDPNGIKIDYILFRASPSIELEVLSYKFPLERRVAGTDYSYSDHEAILATFRLNRTVSVEATKAPDLVGLANTLKEGIAICSTAMEDTNKKSIYYWATAAALFCILLVTSNIIQYDILHSTFHLAFLIILIILLLFFILMATIWCKLEFHGILGARDRMMALHNSIVLEN